MLFMQFRDPWKRLFYWESRERISIYCEFVWKDWKYWTLWESSFFWNYVTITHGFCSEPLGAERIDSKTASQCGKPAGKGRSASWSGIRYLRSWPSWLSWGCPWPCPFWCVWAPAICSAPGWVSVSGFIFRGWFWDSGHLLWRLIRSICPSPERKRSSSAVRTRRITTGIYDQACLIGLIITNIKNK